jgi:hypothetical protein
LSFDREQDEKVVFFIGYLRNSAVER